jgi:hypothetical protein
MALGKGRNPLKTRRGWQSRKAERRAIVEQAPDLQKTGTALLLAPSVCICASCYNDLLALTHHCITDRHLSTASKRRAWFEERFTELLSARLVPATTG